MRRCIRIGSQESRLAVVQTRWWRITFRRPCRRRRYAL